MRTTIRLIPPPSPAGPCNLPGPLLGAFKRVRDKFLPSGCERQRVVGGAVSIETVFPESGEAAAVVEAAQGEDVVRPRFGPEHPGLLAARADHGFAAGFDHARADEVAGFAKAAVLQARAVALEVAERFLHRFGLGA